LVKFGAVQASQDHDDAHHGVADRSENHDSHDSPEPQPRLVLTCRFGANLMATRKVMHHLFAEGTNCPLTEERDATGAPEKIEYPGRWGARAFDLLQFEFLSPGDHGTPYELVDQHNHRHHGENAEENRASIAIVRGGLEIRAETGQAEVTKLLTGHQEEPGPGN